MAYKIQDIEGIGSVYGAKLEAQGIATTGDLLERGGTRAGRAEISATTGLDESLVLTWVNHSDLMRVKGVAGQFSELLEASGVDTVKEFARRNAANLKAAMDAKNEELGLSGRVPSENELQTMIDIAKTLDQKVFH
jgi:predicted flap endonuclease-1-like 5' DNA nuclease